MMPDRIIVRRERGREGNLIAFFPDEESNPGHINYFGCYHCGKAQSVLTSYCHGEASLDYYRLKTRSAPIPEQEELVKIYTDYVRTLPDCEDVSYRLVQKTDPSRKGNAMTKTNVPTATLSGTEEGVQRLAETLYSAMVNNEELHKKVRLLSHLLDSETVTLSGTVNDPHFLPNLRAFLEEMTNTASHTAKFLRNELMSKERVFDWNKLLGTEVVYGDSMANLLGMKPVDDLRNAFGCEIAVFDAWPGHYRSAIKRSTTDSWGIAVAKDIRTDVPVRGEFFLVLQTFDDGCFQSRQFVDPSWQDIMTFFDTCLKQCGDNHVFLEAVRVSIVEPGRLVLSTGS